MDKSVKWAGTKFAIGLQQQPVEFLDVDGKTVYIPVIVGRVDGKSKSQIIVNLKDAGFTSRVDIMAPNIRDTVTPLDEPTRDAVRGYYEGRRAGAVGIGVKPDLIAA